MLVDSLVVAPFTLSAPCIARWAALRCVAVAAAAARRCTPCAVPLCAICWIGRSSFRRRRRRRRRRQKPDVGWRRRHRDCFGCDHRAASLLLMLCEPVVLLLSSPPPPASCLLRALASCALLCSPARALLLHRPPLPSLDPLTPARTSRILIGSLATRYKSHQGRKRKKSLRSHSPSPPYAICLCLRCPPTPLTLLR
jgi:hypothetical protein